MVPLVLETAKLKADLTAVPDVMFKRSRGSDVFRDRAIIEELASRFNIRIPNRGGEVQITTISETGLSNCTAPSSVTAIGPPK